MKLLRNSHSRSRWRSSALVVDVENGGVGVWKATRRALAAGDLGISPQQLDNKEVGVFWDFENCRVPSGLDPFVVKPNIELTLRKNGYLGPVFLKGYGDIQLLSGHVLEALGETGIDLHHVPNGGKNSTDRALVVDILLWANKRLPPAHVFLISGDRDFSLLLHKLRMLKYNVLLAAPFNRGLPAALSSAANKIWLWPDIVKGEGLMGQSHLNDIRWSPGKDHSSDALNNNNETSMYESERNGANVPSMKVTNEDPMKGVVSAYVRGAKPIPFSLLNRIFSIVGARPGISLGDLSKELNVLNVNVACYGFTSLYTLLLSIQGLETHYVNSISVKDRYHFYLASISTDAMKTSLKHSLKQEDNIVKVGGIISESINDTFNQEQTRDNVRGSHSCETTCLDSPINVQKEGGDRSTESEHRLSWIACFFKMFMKS